MVAPEHHHHGCFVIPQGIQKLQHSVARIPHGAQIVVHDVVIVVTHIFIISRGVPSAAAPFHSISGIGSVSLIGNVEVKHRLPLCRSLLIQPQHFRQSHLVISNCAAGQFRIVVIEEQIFFKSQPRHNIPPIVKPFVAGVAAGGPIALVPEIPNIGVGIFPEIPELIVPGEGAALRINGAPGKNIGNQIAGIAFRLNLMIRSVHIAADALDAQIGEIVERLQLESNDVHFLVRRNFFIGVLTEQLLRRLAGISLRGRIHRRGNAVEKRVHKSPGNHALGGGPLNNMLVIPSLLLINGIVAVNTAPKGPNAQKYRRRTGQAHRTSRFSAHQKSEKHRSQNHTCQQKPQTLVHAQIIISCHAHGRCNTGKIRSHKGVVPKQELEIAADTGRQHQNCRQQKADPRPSGEKPEEKYQQHAGQDIQKCNQRVVKITQEYVPAVIAVCQRQTHQSDADAGAQQNRHIPKPIQNRVPGGKVLPGIRLYRRLFFKEFIQKELPR